MQVASLKRRFMERKPLGFQKGNIGSRGKMQENIITDDG
jgi:hypothetical protein